MYPNGTETITSLLGTITRGVLRLYTQLEATLDLVPAVTAHTADTTL